MESDKVKLYNLIYEGRGDYVPKNVEVCRYSDGTKYKIKSILLKEGNFFNKSIRYDRLLVFLSEGRLYEYFSGYELELEPIRYGHLVKNTCWKLYSYEPRDCYDEYIFVNMHELTVEEFQKLVDCYSFFEDIIKEEVPKFMEGLYSQRIRVDKEKAEKEFQAKKKEQEKLDAENNFFDQLRLRRDLNNK